MWIVFSSFCCNSPLESTDTFVHKTDKTFPLPIMFLRATTKGQVGSSWAGKVRAGLPAAPRCLFLYETESLLAGDLLGKPHAAGSSSRAVGTPRVAWDTKALESSPRVGSRAVALGRVDPVLIWGYFHQEVVKSQTSTSISKPHCWPYLQTQMPVRAGCSFIVLNPEVEKRFCPTQSKKNIIILTEKAVISFWEAGKILPFCV